LGTNSAALTLDVASMVAGQKVVVNVEVWDGLQWAGYLADFDGPWRDRQNVLHNSVTLTFSFGSAMVNGVWTPRLSAAGWQVRATFAVTNGPFTTTGGTLVLT
jgi:hypothetical protein